ncbi:MAG: rhodanese-like domain-containing protein [Desulfobacterales bacterium]|nr:rhodanese-like domain-containing protein [Desulfobacterales bacterium]
MPIKHIIYEVGLFVALAATTAFCVNYISPNGIALVGQWDPGRGVISAQSKNDVIVHELEINAPETAKKIYDSAAAVFVDARARGFFDKGHIKGAFSLPLHEAGTLMETFKEKFSLSTYVITYCSGRECDDSHQLAQIFLENGYHNVSIYIDGYPGWIAKGYPVE